MPPRLAVGADWPHARCPPACSTRVEPIQTLPFGLSPSQHPTTSPWAQTAHCPRTAPAGVTWRHRHVAGCRARARSQQQRTCLASPPTPPAAPCVCCRCSRRWASAACGSGPRASAPQEPSTAPTLMVASSTSGAHCHARSTRRECRICRARWQLLTALPPWRTSARCLMQDQQRNPDCLRKWADREPVCHR